MILTGQKLEEIARLLTKEFGGDPDEFRDFPGERRVWAWEAALPSARAVIKAMREPNEALKKFAGQC